MKFDILELRNLKKEFEKGCYEELSRIGKEMSVLDVNSKEYDDLLKKQETFSGMLTAKTEAEAREKVSRIDNGSAFLGIFASCAAPILFEVVSSSSAWTFFKAKLRH